MALAVSAREREKLIANGLAHKLRNSLNTMRTHIALLQKFTATSPEERALRQISKLEEAVIGIEEILREFLAFASPATGELAEVDLPGVVREVLEFLLADLEQSGVKVTENYEGELPRLYADRNQLKRVLLNLMINARQAMPDGGRLTIRACPADDGFVLLEISDTGSGIPMEEQDLIFQPFFTTKAEGLGLGLPVVKRTLEDLHGRISFESKPGVGTVFRVFLPSAEHRREVIDCEAHRQEWLQTVQS